MKDEVGFKSSDTFDVLSERIRSVRANRDQIEWSSISLEMQGVPINHTRSYGVARIDNSLFRNLGGDPTSFRVEPGEHRVAVQLSRCSDFRIIRKLEPFDPGRGPARRARQAGLRPTAGAKEEWRMIHIASIHLVLSFFAASLVAAGFVWFVYTFVVICSPRPRFSSRSEESGSLRSTHCPH